jgi:uncharacterized membrane protein
MIESFIVRMMIWFGLGYILGKISIALGLGIGTSIVLFFLVLFPIFMIIINPYAWKWFKGKFKNETGSE